MADIEFAIKNTTEVIFFIIYPNFDVDKLAKT